MVRAASKRSLAAYRRAGTLAYDLRSLADEHRRGLASEDGSNVEGIDEQLLLCAWNAWALQTLGDALTSKSGDRQTSAQAARLYREVSGWIANGHQAAAGIRVLDEHSLPGLLPLDGDRAPWSSSHAGAMLSACGELRLTAETTPLDAQAVGADEDELKRLNSTLARAAAADDFAQRVCGDEQFERLTVELRSQVQEAVIKATNGFYLAGQYAAMPRLTAVEPHRELGASSLAVTRRQAEGTSRLIVRPRVLLALVPLAVVAVVSASWDNPSSPGDIPPPVHHRVPVAPVQPWRWNQLRVSHGVVQVPDDGSASGYEPDTEYQNVQNAETEAFANAKTSILSERRPPTGAKLASDLILANPHLQWRFSVKRDPATGLGNIRTNENAAETVAAIGIGIGASDETQFVATAYTVYGTRCVFRFNYKTGIVQITP